jgi:GNAT superfamily N-acetyltransferase
MNINELDTYNLADAVKFHRRLNPRIWGRDEHLLPEVQDKLLAIATDFQEFLGVEDLNIQDITISGSNAAYSYTKHSDIDLHLIVEMPSDPVYQELFNAKKYQYNDEHNIKIGGADVELYVQPADQTHVSQGVYSIQDNKWISIPQRKRAQVDDACVRDKVASLDARIHSAVKSKNLEAVTRLWDKIKAMRKIGLEQHGEFGCENISFKLLRNSGCIKLLKDTKTALEDRELSLREAEPRQRFRYGFSEGMQSQPYSTSDGVAASTKQFLEDSTDNSIVQDFIQHVTMELGIDPVPEIHLHTDPAWSKNNHSFGRYDPDTHTLNVSMPNRHVMDVLRTVAHELVHCSQNQQHGRLPDDAGETGSRWENNANARAGIIMRDWANSHPEHFAHGALEENASGYIPKNKREAAQPQYAMALSVDIKPGQVGREANKLGLKTGRNGEPGLLMKSANLQESLAAEFELFEEQDLFEINMGSKNLRREAAKTGAIAGMEFEMIVPGMESDDPEQEPDYDSDQRCRSIDDAVQFFHDGDYNGRRDVERLRERMQNDFLEWRDEKLRDDWSGESEDYIRDWLRNNVNDDEWNPNELTGDERNEVFDEFAANVDADPSSDYYNQAFDEWREEFQDNYDESDWLDAEDLDLMSSVENAYEITWPYWTSINSGEIDADQVADEFSQAVGREVRVNTRYHQSGDRPGPNNQFYVVEPDGSLEGDNDGDEGLEFVSPPMPIDELLKDLNAVKVWAGRMGVYTNSSTGLHINISVPDYSIDRLDYVKLALLLGDEYVLNQFGRSSNTYTKSALGKVRDRVRSNPEDAQRLLDKMKGQMGELASKAIHSGITDKYTSINTKNGHIEFRSPGGDWLDDNFDKIENTLLRFTVAMSAALNPEAYREEYQKKLYKLLTQDQKDSDTIRYFSDYVAGKIPKAALRSFVKQAQLERKVKRGEAGNQKMWWNVSNPGNSYASVEVVATTREEAIEKALGADGYPSWANTRQSVVAKPMRPYEEAKGPTLNSRPSNPDGNWVIVDRQAPRTPVYRFMASDNNDALTVLRQWISANQGQGREWNFATDANQSLGQPGQPAAQPAAQPAEPQGGRPNDPNGRYAIVPRSDPALYGSSTGGTPDYQFRFNMGDPAAQAQGRYVLQAWAARNNVVAADYMVVDTEQWDRPADAASGGIIDIEPDVAQALPGSTAALAQQRATPGTFSGAWKVMVNGEEVHRFSGIGNNQSDANRVAAQWLRNNGRGVSGEGFEVVPIMTEGVAEAFDQPYKTKTEKSDYGDVDMLARLPDGTNLSIMFNKQQNNDGEETIQVEFYRNNSQEVTGEGDAQKIFATVLTSIQKYIKKYKPARLSFSASKATDPTIYYEPDQPQPNPESRAKLYDRLVQRYARAWGYRAFRADTGDLVIYELSRLQPAVTEGKDRYGNFDPPGPETPPTMPAGTVRVDVSDVYDWYKLGQHISNMKGLGKHDFGKGPPSAIVSFGDEDLEHQYIQALKQTGLTTTDIDPVDPNQPAGMPRQKTDPTYNVDENFADGRNPVKFTVTTPDGYAHSFQITLAVHGKHVGHFNFVRSADTDDVNNEAEVESRWQGQGYGKLLLMKAIDVANNHGLDFQQDIRGITNAQQNVYDSLENAGLIVTPGDGFWFLTPQGEQELNGLNENFADGRNPGRKGLAKRVGVNTKASVSDLRKTAKNSSGEKQRMAHWLANMKAGRAKAKRK